MKISKNSKANFTKYEEEKSKLIYSKEYEKCIKRLARKLKI